MNDVSLALTLHYQGIEKYSLLWMYETLQFDFVMNKMANLSVVLKYPIGTVVRGNPAQPTNGGTTMRVHVLLCHHRLIYIATTSQQKATGSYLVTLQLAEMWKSFFVTETVLLQG